ACAAILDIAKRCNKYIDETMPWALAKDETQKDRLNDVLYNLLDLIKIIGTLLKPIMPETAEKIAGANTCEDLRTADCYSPQEAPNLFPRLETEKVLAEIYAEIEAKAKATEEKIEGIAQIGIEDFAKVELKAAKIITCEAVPKAKKLLKLTLDDGNGHRTVASGIAKWYKPEDLIGHTVVLVSNLKPAKLCGVESNGMILAADCSEDDVKVLFIDNIPAGAKIR
ncbi:MAG: methionine--tRNA ligase subunit beta, partial [Clostridia bacterium]|nr:methionine--tRNA ligase subunit beta [Clostridia bacterium]